MGLRHVRKGDIVGVISGKFRGQSGRVMEVLVKRGRVRIEGIATIKRHLKPNRDPKVPQGGIVERLGSIHISNVLPLDPQSKKPSRVGTRQRPDGSRVRYLKRSNQELADGR